MTTFIAFAVIVLAIVYSRWLLKMCDKDDEQREKAKNKIVNGISLFIAISIIIAVIVVVIYLIWIAWYFFCGGAMILDADSIVESFFWLIFSILMLAYILSIFIRR